MDNKDKTAKLALWQEMPQPFNFKSLVKPNSVQTVMNIPVKIDKVLYDLTGETVVGVTGTFVVKGIKIRGCWDPCGNILHFRKTGILFGWQKIFDNLFAGCSNDMFQLVVTKNIECHEGE